MANEVMHRADVTSGTLRFTIRNNSGQMWSTPATANFVTLVAANWANYLITLTESEVGASYYYTGTFPAIAGNMIAGWYTVDIFNGALIGSTLIGTQYGYWDGTNYHLDAANVKEWIDVVPLALSSQLVQGADTAGTTELLTRVLEPSADAQAIARERYGVSGTVWHVAYNASETMGNDALSWATADLTAGVGVQTDIQAAVAGDLVQIGAGTFTLGNKTITTVAGTKIAGAGADITTITSTKGSIFAENIIVLSSNTEVSDTTIEALSTAGKPIGTSAVFTNAVIRRARTVGDFDGLWVSQDSACTCSVYDSEFEAKYDSVGIYGAGDHAVQMFNCIIKTVGPSLQAATNPSHGAWCSTGTLWLWNCHVHCQDGNAGYPTVGLCAFGTANIYMFGGSIRTSNAANTDLAVENSGTGKIVLIGVDYDRTKVSNTSTGSIIDIPMHALDSNGLTIQAAADLALTAFPVQKSNVAVTAPADMALASAQPDIDTLTIDGVSKKVVKATTYGFMGALFDTVTTTFPAVMAAAFKKLFNIATPANTVNDLAKEATLTAMKGATFTESTDSLEAIRDRGDAAWATATIDVDAILDEPLAGHTTAGTVGAKLNLLAGGPGATATTILCQVGGLPIDGVEVWITTDLAGVNIVAGVQSSDTDGETAWTLDPGSYYAWRQKSGVNFTNPYAFTVT